MPSERHKKHSHTCTLYIVYIINRVFSSMAVSLMLTHGILQILRDQYDVNGMRRPEENERDDAKMNGTESKSGHTRLCIYVRMHRHRYKDEVEKPSNCDRFPAICQMNGIHVTLVIYTGSIKLTQYNGNLYGGAATLIATVISFVLASFIFYSFAVCLSLLRFGFYIQCNG